MHHQQLPSDREYTIAKAIHQWHQQEILHYVPRSEIDGPKKNVFGEEDFELHEHYAVCPNGKRLRRKPNVALRGSSEQWRYQARQSDCRDCPLRRQCSTGAGSRMLCVNVYREDLTIRSAL